MKICLAQTRPVKGNIQSNIKSHENLIDVAVSNGAEVIIFPELSLTGYEPSMAKDLATHKDDIGLDVFQNTSDKNKIIIGIGIPTKHVEDTCISMVIFQPHRERQLYSKKYLHEDEEPFFVKGENSYCLLKNHIALAICYELSIPEHSENAYDKGAKIYMASVAKTAGGIDKASETLSAITKKYSMTVLMSNCVGQCDNFQSAGQSSVWNNNGELLAQLDDKNEGLLIFDTETQEVLEPKLLTTS